MPNPTLDYASPAPAPPTSDPRFAHSSYVIRRRFFKLLGAAFHVYDAAGNPLMYSKQKAFRLREDIRVYTGEDMQTELLAIRARKIIDFGAAYDVVDSPSGGKVGALKRKGLKSMLRDEWVVMDAFDREIGLIQEESTALALIRRFVEAAAMFLPQKYQVTIGGRQVAFFQQNMNPFIKRVSLDFWDDPEGRFDRRLGVAAAALLSAIEGRQG